jgi:hypothetical protein
VIEDIGTLPGLERAPWSSRYLQGLIDVPYLNLTPSRLYVKELVLKNFRGLPAERLMERMMELSLYVEEKLKPA